MFRHPGLNLVAPGKQSPAPGVRRPRLLVFCPRCCKHACVQVVKIGEGTYGEAFKSGQVVLKFVPMEGPNLINGWPQKGAGDLLGEAVIALALTDLAQERDESGGEARVTGQGGRGRLMKARCAWLLDGVYKRNHVDACQWVFAYTGLGGWESGRWRQAACCRVGRQLLGHTMPVCCLTVLTP